MIDQSLAHQSTHRIERIAEQAEQELDRLRRGRPHLTSRVEKAESIVCRQLGNLNGYRPIRVRLHPDGDYTYLVASDGKLNRRYEVNPHTWSCNCPDHRRREAACKHALAAWVLERAHQALTGPPPKTGPCAECGRRFRHRDLYPVADDSLTYFEGDELCEEHARAHGVL